MVGEQVIKVLEHPPGPAVHGDAGAIPWTRDGWFDGGIPRQAMRVAARCSNLSGVAAPAFDGCEQGRSVSV